MAYEGRKKCLIDLSKQEIDRFFVFIEQLSLRLLSPPPQQCAEPRPKPEDFRARGDFKHRSGVATTCKIIRVSLINRP